MHTFPITLISSALSTAVVPASNMARTTALELSEYERKRQETIAKNQQILRDLQLNAAQAGLAPKARSSNTSAAGSKKKPKPVAKPKEPPIATRSSSRLRGIVADSDVAKRKAEDEVEAQQLVERAKRQRVTGDLNVDDILLSGKTWDMKGNFLSTVGPAQPYERTFDPQRSKKTSSKELSALRERLGGLQLWEDIEPSRIKITPERIYALTCHPTTDKALVFAGDKVGNLGIFDTSQAKLSIKVEDDEEADDDFEPHITTLKLHSRPISSLQTSLVDTNSLYSSSYDSSIRRLDLNKGVAIEAYAPKDSSADEPLSAVQLSPEDANMLYFSTLDGSFGQHDMRVAPHGSGTQLYSLCDKKIGGFSLHPLQPHIFATASLDRTIKLWDLRKLTGRGENRVPTLVGTHESKLSVSHAAFNYAGQVVTTSYDDTIKVHTFEDCGSWKAGHTIDDEEMSPTTIIPHNNQTGRWVTM